MIRNISLCILYGLTYPIAAAEMEKVDAAKSQLTVISFLDTARYVATSFPPEVWQEYTLSSSVIAQIIKEKEFGSTYAASTQETDIIEHLKNNDEQAAVLLTQKTLAILKDENKDKDLTRLQALRHAINLFDEKHVQEKEQQLAQRKRYIQRAYAGHDAAWGIFACVVIILEIPLIVTGWISADCWS